MNPPLPTPQGGIRRTLRVLSLLLLQHALAPTGTNAHARSRLPSDPDSDFNEAESRPYLKVAGSLPLRFSAAPRPILSPPAKSAVATESVRIQTTAPLEPSSHLSPTVSPVEVRDSAEAQPSAPTAPLNGKPTLSILPDDTHPSTRAEDFLPFFQFPSGGDVTVVVPASVVKPPAPGQMPVSSATYQQR